MNDVRAIAVSSILACCAPGATADEIALDRDDVRITASAVIQPGIYRSIDRSDDGAVRISGDDITIDFQGAELVGSDDNRQPDRYSGKGIVVRGRNITLRNARVRGYKVGIHAEGAAGLVIEDVDVSDNYRQRLLSTPEAEDVSDWLYPHDNDTHEWLTRYGAGMYVEKSNGVTLRRVRARRGQNGIILDRVNDSKIYDNDCSFLSGWGLALWRSNRNTISRNAFDFCIRGYSHGVYNRGQDSAGILMFEQCCGNIIAENSATHGGDGLFGFGGNESLASSGRTGNNQNLLINNDFSYAAAHGAEMTFSFDNQFWNNRQVGNAICGLWAGYSQSTIISGNVIENNGEAGHGAEGGGINIEHGCTNKILANAFARNTCGVYLWSDDDGELLKKPWCLANHKGSTANEIVGNSFTEDRTAIRLRETSRTTLTGNCFTSVGQEVDTDETGQIMSKHDEPDPRKPPELTIYGDRRPLGARAALRGRENIILTEWGPYDFTEPLITPQTGHGHTKVAFRVLGTTGSFEVKSVRGSVTVVPRNGAIPAEISVQNGQPGLHAFELEIAVPGSSLIAGGSLLNTDWIVKFFKWEPSADPREHQEQWDALLAGQPLDTLNVPVVDFRWGGGSATEKVPRNHFGTLATTTVHLPAGGYLLHTVSDDGIRVWVDETRVIDDWTWHGPTPRHASVTLEEGLHHVRVEHFEIDGYAQLQFGLIPVDSSVHTAGGKEKR